MIPETQRLPMADRRARVLEYLRGMDLPFTSVAGTIVSECLSGAKERDLLRPSLVLWASGACGGDERDALPVAAAFALFDLFTDLHDELVEPPARASSVARWGLGQSLNAGDALYALALRTLAEDVAHPQRRLAVAALVSTTVLQAIEGRTIDVERTARGARDGPFTRIRSVRRRSAALTGAALQSGALLAGAGAAVERGFDRAGRLLDAATSVGATDRSLRERVGRKAEAAIARFITDEAALDEFGAVVEFVSGASQRSLS